ncbi:unnamed protein product [Meganyctiphanes norvegica]|uniref:DUF4832 domain-containing protein n=1 Tax=Meganyctiphanes norvegica TaxID=48144 RepID=A0AAV2R2Y7_MEGNR
MLVRFAYSYPDSLTSTTPDENHDAPLEQAIKHIQQLAPLLQDHIGVISAMYAGFIGAWGEWYYTQNYGNEDDLTSEDWDKRLSLVEVLLDALPYPRQIMIRYPHGKQRLLNREDPLQDNEAHDDSAAARLGHHNDCFLAKENDQGTYTDKPKEYPYLQQETRVLIQGGETCQYNPPRTSCPTALKEMCELHYTFLNHEFHERVISGWEEQKCIEEIRWSLGYRLVGIRAVTPETATIGDQLCLSITLKNIGWAAPINPRTLQIILRHTNSGEEITLPADPQVDPRKWLPGEHNFQTSNLVTADAPEGQYQVVLCLGDPAPDLAGLPEYNIVMENLEDTEYPEKRLNLLGNLQILLN